MKPPRGRFSTDRRASMTILIIFAIALWLLICVGVVALAKTAARGDAPAAPQPEPRFERTPEHAPSSRNPR
jgi:hypothetical protein